MAGATNNGNSNPGYRSIADLHFGAEFDRPPFDGAQRFYFLCSAPRAGSYLLADLLAGSGGMGVPAEYFNPNEMKILGAHFDVLSENERLNLERYVAAIGRHRTTPNGVFGAKLEFWQAKPLLAQGLLFRLFPDARYLYLTREDLLAQAVSLAIARQTGQWRSTMRRRRVMPRYSAKAILAALDFVQAEQANWEKLFALTGIAPLRLTYESLLADAPGVCGVACAYVGVETDHGFDLARSRLDRQANVVNEAWIARVRRDTQW